MKKFFCAFTLALTMIAACAVFTACDYNGSVNGGCNNNSSAAEICFNSSELPSAPDKETEGTDEEFGREEPTFCRDGHRCDGHRRNRPGPENRNGEREPRPRPRENEPQEGEIYFCIFGKLPFPPPGFGFTPPAEERPGDTQSPAPEIPDGELG